MKKPSKKEILNNLDRLGVSYNKTAKKNELESVLMESTKLVDDEADIPQFTQPDPGMQNNNSPKKAQKNRSSDATYRTNNVVIMDGVVIAPDTEITLTPPVAKRLMKLNAVSAAI